MDPHHLKYLEFSSDNAQGRVRLERRLTAILAADVVGYTCLMGDDEVGTLRRLTELRE
jgi:class 3 adenylate cyclase